jgi:hypothetical protein
MLHAAIAVMPMDEEPCPVQVGFLGLNAIVQAPNVFTELIQDARGLQLWRGDFLGFCVLGYKPSTGVQSLVNKEKFAVGLLVLSRRPPRYPADLQDTSKLGGTSPTGRRRATWIQ